MNKLISANYWFGCDWWLCEVGYLGMRAGQLSLACAGVYLWNTGHLRVTDPRMCSGFQQGLMLKQWINFNKLENFNSILNYPIDDFTPSGNLSYINQHGDILHHTPLREAFNLRCYIQHLMDETEDQDENPLKYENWIKQNNWKFIKYLVHHRHPMTPEQHKQKPFEEIFKNQHEKVSTTSSEESEQDSESGTQLLKMKRNQIQLKHIKFIMF